MPASRAALNAALKADDPTTLFALIAAGGLEREALVAEAALARAPACLDALLAAGHPVDAVRLDGLGALHLSKDAKITRRLLAAGASVNLNRGRGTPLHLAAANAGPPVIKALLDGGANPDALDRDQDTALAVACRSHRTGAVEALLARPPRPEVCTAILGNFAQRGLQRKDGDVLRVLLAHLPADLDPLPGVGHALHLAARSGSVEAVSALLAAGAQVDRPDPQDRTPLWLALDAAGVGFLQKPRNVAAAKVLLAAGADLDRRCGDSTPRERAAANGVAL